MSLRLSSASVAAVLMFSAGPLHAQQPNDSSAYASFAIDSSSIRGLPLVRDSEVPSFLPRTTQGLSYQPVVRAAIGGTDFRIDGVPVENATFGHMRMELPALLLKSVQLFANGTSVLLDRPTALEYFTVAGGREWNGLARVGSDIGMPGHIGSFRGEAAAHGGLGNMRLNVALNAQSAHSTEFNNFGDAPIYVANGIDTTITFQTSPGNFRTVPIPAFEEADSDQLPGSNWNQVVGGARLDLMHSSSQNLFAAFNYHRLQEAQYRGFNLYNLGAQTADRLTSTFFAIGYDRALRASSLSLRLARTSDERLHGVLDSESALNLDSQGDGPNFGAYSFLIDNDDFPLNDELIQRIRTNAQEPRTPFPETRGDLSLGTDFRLNPYATLQFPTRGVASTNYEYERETRLFGSAVWSVPVRSHALKVGGEGSLLKTEGLNTPYRSILSQEIWIEEPTLLAAFLEDAFRAGPLFIQAGLRYDMFNNGAEYAETPGYLEESFNAESQSSISPRIAIRWANSALAVNTAAGRAATPADLYSQYNTIHRDLFRFGNTNTNTVFARPLDLIEQTYASVNVGAVASAKLSFTGSLFWSTSDDLPSLTLVRFEDPTNAGSFTNLRIPVSGQTDTRNAIDAGVRYGTSDRSFVEVSGSRLSQKFETGNASGDFSFYTVTGLAQFAVPSFGNGLDFTLALRAQSPPDESAGISWITRFDARISQGVTIGGIRGAVWLNAFRLAGASPYFDHEAFYEPGRAPAIATHRITLGNGLLQDNVDLTSLAAAGDGVRNEVDLYLLQQAEARFGNGDRQFNADEQTRAFGAAFDFESTTSTALSQSRRFELGVELSF